MSIRGSCPKCRFSLTEEELRANPPVCPSCKAKLQVVIKANWIYAVLSLGLAWVIASSRGYESIVLAFWALIYGTVILAVIMFYRWELHLPIRILEVPDCQLWPTDAP